MSSLISSYANSKTTLMSVYPVTWIPGSLTGTLPFFSVQSNTLYFRADDPNLYGINFSGGVASLPPVFLTTDNKIHVGNKGRNFYSAPWAIPTFPSKDTGKRIEVKAVDPSIYTYIQSFYLSLTNDTTEPNPIQPITLDNFKLEQTAWAKQYQITNANQNANVNGVLYFGANPTKLQNSGVGGVAKLTEVSVPNLSSTLTSVYNGSPLTAWQQPYNTFYALDTPLIISAIDTNNSNTKLYFTLENTVQLYNNNF